MALISSARKHVCCALSLRSCYGTTVSSDVIYDMVIVGGGMVGLALAAAVGQTSSMAGKKVLLLEASTSSPPITTPTQPYSNRVCTLSLKSVDLLKRLNAWTDITNVRAKSFKKLYVWDSCSPANITFDNMSDFQFNIPSELDESHDFSDVTSDDLMGYLVENNVILKALSDEVSKLNIEVKRGVVINKLNHTQPKEDDINPLVTLDLADDTSVKTRLLVGSDGDKSQVRKLSNFEVLNWSYNQHGVVATLHLQEGLTDNNVAWQRFLPDGPIALLPLSDTQSSLVWSTTPSHAKQLLAMSEDQFVDAVNVALFEEFPQDSTVSISNAFVKSFLSVLSSSSVPVKQLPPTVSGAEGRGSFPLSFSYAPQCVKSRIALIGDAAHRIHPLAGLGVNLGFNDVICLHSELLNTTAVGGEWGDLSGLLSYESRTQRENVPIMATIECLHRLFTTSYEPVVLLRSLGLQMTGAIQPVKDFIMKWVQGTR